MKYIEFQYQDGGNYKWNCTIAITDAKFKQLEKKYKTICEGTELDYDNDLGISRDEFHEERGYVYDAEIDHNLIEVVTIKEELPEGEITTWTIE